MLRAIGAQIEKTTNREACRDLSGRRLRDINEEQRCIEKLDKPASREGKGSQRKEKKKLERLCEKPRHEFKDEKYDKERSELPEKVEDALLQGLQASYEDLSCSSDENEQSDSEETNDSNEISQDSRVSSESNALKNDIENSTSKEKSVVVQRKSESEDEKN
ncbi:hypothetical protein NQ314_019015 [Rhamnusium bicolor]|uniref:SDE2-like domain-containing protein n=1 Tax=Rhamnusium bicolor TaxID=1586634 RepID=A0AAV8WPP7_9CUCU|nr:hypothetical protein NQ314_019015 [Rhamnusium bicolor]